MNENNIIYYDLLTNTYDKLSYHSLKILSSCLSTKYAKCVVL